MSASIHHPTGITVEIVGIEANSNGQSCYQHDICGTLVAENVVLRLRKAQILNCCVGRGETAIAAYHVSDGVDQCRVGFLQRHFIAHAKTFDGASFGTSHRGVFCWLGATVQSSKRSGDTTWAVVWQRLSLIFRLLQNALPARPPPLSWLTLQKERKTVQKKWCSSPVWEEKKTFLCPMRREH